MLTPRTGTLLHLPLVLALALAVFGLANLSVAERANAEAADHDADESGPEGDKHDGDHHKDRDEHHEHSGERNKGVLEEVIVTAQKREENLQKIPLAVSVVTGAELQRAGVTDAQGLTDLVPGLEVGNYGSTVTFVIRGVTTNTDPNLGDSPTAFHIDGVYQGRPAAASGLFYDVDHVEVLKGPQGTLYGKNSTGGTINLITNKPNFAGTSGSFAGELGNYNLVRTYGEINVPLNQDWAVRGSFQTQNHTGYLDSGYNDADDLAGRVHVLWRPSETFSALFSQDYFHQGGTGNGQIPIPQAGDYWYNNPWSVKDSTLQAEGSAGFSANTNDVTNQTTLQLEWLLGPGKLTSVSGYHHLHLDATSFLNGTPSRQEESDSEVSQEIRLASLDGSPTKWVVGAYFHRESQQIYADFYNQAGPGTDSVQVFPTLITPSYALFGQMTYPLSPTWRLTAGLRANYDNKRLSGGVDQYAFPVDFSQDPPVVDRTATPDIIPQASADANLVSRRLTWRFGMDTDLNANSLLFFNVATGYKQGGVFAGIPPDNAYSPETMTAYEIGSKNRFLDNRLQVNVDAFYYDYSNYQVDQLEYLHGLNGTLLFGDYITNAARAVHKGAELSIDSLVTRNDTVSLNVSYLSAVFKEFQYPLPPDFSAPPSTTYTYVDLSGYSEFSAPRWTGTLTYQHLWKLQNAAQLAFYVQSHAESYYWLTPDHKPDSRQPGYTRTYLALQYTSPAGKYSLQGYVQNLENRAVYNNYTFQGDPPAHNYATIDPPRTYGAVFEVKF